MREMAATARLSVCINMQGPNIAKNHLCVKWEHSIKATKVSEPLSIRSRTMVRFDSRSTFCFHFALSKQDLDPPSLHAGPLSKGKTGQNQRRPCTSHSNYHLDFCRYCFINICKSRQYNFIYQVELGSMWRCLDLDASL